MAMVNSLTKGSAAMPIMDEAIIMWPVDDTGKNSVIPSIMARIITWMIFIEGRLGVELD
jgi:hypothetical protein